MNSKINYLIALNYLILAGCVDSQNLSEISSGPIQNSEKVSCTSAPSKNSNHYGGGVGTKDNPYLICTVDQFKKIQGDMGNKRFFKLTSDLDFSNEGNLRIIAISPFASIDGDGHKLTNITIKHGYGYKDNGLFGQLVKDVNGNRDEIKNLTIENVKILGDGDEDGGGVIASANYDGIISNVHVKGLVQIEYPSFAQSHFAVGGLVGRNSWIIENSSFEGDVSGESSVGGIAGINEGIIRNSKSAGSVNGFSGVGGIIGIQAKKGIMEGCTSDASVVGSQEFGSLVGLQSGSN